MRISEPSEDNYNIGMSRKILFLTGWRYLLRHPWQTFLMILGITLGVAVVISVDLANASASRAFDLSTETVAGKATHQISGGPQGLDEDLYVQLVSQGWGVPMAPAISDYASSPELDSRTLQLLGIDPFAEGPFRNYLGSPNAAQNSTPIGAAPDHLINFLTLPGAILISEDNAVRHQLKIGQTITLESAGKTHLATIVGLIKPADSLSRRALDGIILTDIATAQELTGRLGLLDRIDLILPETSVSTSLLKNIQSQLPASATLQPVEARSGAVAQMTTAFRVNLTALSMLALVVGLFLIYNTITFSVVQRRPLFGVLRNLGVTREEVFLLVLSEAFLVGLLGAFFGAGLGIILGQGTVRLVTQTINDLFFVVTVRGIQIPLSSLVKGISLGVIATLLAAAPPAWEAASVPPRLALSRSGLESKARRAVGLAAWWGLAFITAGVGLLWLPSDSLVVSFAATFAIVVGFAMLTPLSTKLIMRGAAPWLGSIWGILGRMAPRNVVNSLSRTSIAVMALMVAVSVTIGVSLMVSSFRATVITWLGETLQNDIYISAPGLNAQTPSIVIEPSVKQSLQQIAGVQRIDALRSTEVESPEGQVHIAATDNFTLGEEKIYLSRSVPEGEIWQSMLNGAVIVSEPFANRLGLDQQKSTITLNTDNGLHTFEVIGVYYDYASTQGTVSMALSLYQDLWKDPDVTALGLRLTPDADLDTVVQAVEAAVSTQQRLIVRPNQALRNEVLEVFDRTFAITAALQMLATIVAFIGVLSALLSLALEKQRELGILRSVGMTVRQLWGLIMLETGLMGSVAGLLALPTGYTLALILIYIINRRSFGWTLQMQVEPLPFIQAIFVAILAALIAGIYPALRMSRMAPSDAMRSE
jgi:putative ABC transport system permease protein